MSLFSTRSRNALLIAILMSLLVLSPGCNVIGFLAEKTIPPPKVPAEFELGNTPTAVVVTADAALAGEQGPMDAEALAIALEGALQRQAGAKVVDESVAGRIVRVRLHPPEAHGAIGSDYYSGHASASVRVDADSGTEVWPRDGSEGRVIQAETPRVRGADDAQIRRATLQALASKIAALFHPREMRSGE